MGNITAFFTAVPIDYFFLAGIVIFVALDSLRSGIGRAAALSVALPLALLFHALLDNTIAIGGMIPDSAMIQAVVFGVIVALSYLLVRRMGLEYISGGIGQPVQALIAGVALTVIFLVVWLESPVLEALFQFQPQITAFFNESYRLLWFLGAYAALAFARG
jgi:hypothetical protein